MKKLIAVLLVLLLVSNLAGVFLLIQNNRLMQQLLQVQLSASQVRNDVPSGSAQPSSGPQPSGETVVLVQEAQELFLEPDGSWHFNFAFENTTSTDLYIRALTFLDNGDYEDRREIGQDPMLFEWMMGPDPASKALKPGEMFVWGDAHPGEHLITRTYRFEFVGDDGVTYIAEFAYDLRMETRDGMTFGPVDYSGDEGQDLLTLRHGAGFAVEVAPDVFWVPVNVLGTSRYTNAEISGMIYNSPEEKQRDMATLYEALQLYQVSGFAASDDNIRIPENGVDWEHHKPGYYAVATNNGCCATSANWLNYILAGDYEQVGFVATSQRDGSGHIYNYIYHDGWYYFIDLTHYRTDWVATAVEDGELDSYYNSDFILGNCHRARSVQAYVDYVQSTFNDPPGLMFQYTAENCLAVDGRPRGQDTVIIYEDDPQVQVQVIFDDPGDRLTFELQPPPRERPRWD